MSVAQILEESKTFSLPELESLEHSIRLERLRRVRRVGPDEERRLLKIINQPMPHAERFAVLTQKWQDEGLADEERTELLAIVTQREGQNAERVEAVGRLSELRGVAFSALWATTDGRRSGADCASQLMARATIPVAVARAVRGRAREQCEYCRAPENFNTDLFSIEHIHPLSRGGSNQENNLALSCLGCNLAKGARIDALDPVTGQRITLFHPRRDSWSEQGSGAKTSRKSRPAPQQDA